MTIDVPRFAVVGHPNKGKSSIVATLAEDDTVKISPEPGTTTRTRAFPLRVDGETLYELYDTPGFQRAREVLAWLRAHDRGASARPEVLREFVTAHRGDARFADECELLAPILDGAGILYVVNGAHPYGEEYESEMEILRWSGQPRLALINKIGPGDHVAQWRTALDQYFAIVREFDAVHADFDKRTELLRAFGELRDSWRAPLERAVAALTAERTQRARRAAAEIAALLCDVLTLTVRAAAADAEVDAGQHERLVEELKRRIRERERDARRAVQEIYRHAGVARDEEAAAVLDADVFAATSFSIFGLSNAQLAATAAVSGAAALGGIDLLLGGASLGLAAAIGAVVGGAGALFAASELAKVRLLGQRLGGYTLVVGPVTAANFPWVILGRALLHRHIVAERNHARREAMALPLGAGAHLADSIESGPRQRLQSAFRVLVSNQEADAETRSRLEGEIATLIFSQEGPGRGSALEAN